MRILFWASTCILMAGVCCGSSNDCSTGGVLTRIRPGAAWAMQGDSYDTVNWLDNSQTKPRYSEVKEAMKACEAELKEREARKTQARLDVKNPKVPVEKKVEQLILLLDLDQ